MQIPSNLSLYTDQFLTSEPQKPAPLELFMIAHLNLTGNVSVRSLLALVFLFLSPLVPLSLLCFSFSLLWLSLFRRFDLALTLPNPSSLCSNLQMVT